jgi:glycosyltransferase involved in cell wall biosynthesis
MSKQRQNNNNNNNIKPLPKRSGTSQPQPIPAAAQTQPAGAKTRLTGVLGLYDGVDNGCSYYRLIQPFAELNSFGQPFEWMSLADQKLHLAGQPVSGPAPAPANNNQQPQPQQMQGHSFIDGDLSCKHYNIVTLLRPVVTIQNEEDKPLTKESIEIMESLVGNVHATGALFAGDFDDDMWAVEPHNPAFKELGLYQTDRIKETIKRLDFVTCSTPYLAKRIVECCSVAPEKVNVIPNMIDFGLFDRPDWELPVPGQEGEVQHVDMTVVRRNRMLQDDTNRPLVIGLQGGNSHIQDWQQVSRALRQVWERYGEKVRFVIAGGHFDYMQEDLKEATDAGLVWWKGWTPFAYHSETIMQFDINLCPLNDTLFNRSKSGIKWMEASAAGAATIASPTVYGHYIQPGKTGLIARSAQDWYDGLCLLIEKPDMRRFIARNAHLLVRSHYNLETGAYLWNNVFNQRWQELGGTVAPKVGGMEYLEMAEMAAMRQAQAPLLAAS